MDHSLNPDSDTHVSVINPSGAADIVVVCEHASAFIPEQFHNLGLVGDALHSHAAWDPGALGVAQGVSQHLDAPLVAAGVSRLIYDCNRPPSAPDAMPPQSEAFRISGNENLTDTDRASRVSSYYAPFQARLAATIAAKVDPVVVTIHSFTPIYHGQSRAVEIGVLHDADSRLADAMMDVARVHSDAKVMLNEPYGRQHGVTHTLQEHGVKHGHLNVMLEIRNDLIKTDAQQFEMAKMLTVWIADALARLDFQGAVKCST